MYIKNYYKIIDKTKIRQDAIKQGFNPIEIYNEPGYVYSLHKHPETKLLVFLEGDMDVSTQGKVFHCRAGDKLIIPGNTPHSAIVGNEGCKFFWSEKIIQQSI